MKWASSWPMPESGEPLSNSHDSVADLDLEAAIGREVRTFRKRLNMTLQDVTRVTGLSTAMLSKIENGQATPSLGTLKALARAFEVPINVFFRSFEERRDASYVAAGEGVQVSRSGRAVRHHFSLIGHSASPRVAVEPYLVRLDGDTEVFPRRQDTGVWFIHMLEGRLVFRYGDQLYRLNEGDSLTYDAEAPHGIDEVITKPVTFLCVHADRRES